MRPDIAFDLTLEHGRCVGVRIPAETAAIDALGESALRAEERAFAAGLARLRRRTWIAGRVALRQALERAGLDCAPILPDARGAPVLDAGISGSISHTNTVAVGLVATTLDRVGVDVEADRQLACDIGRHVLTAAEAEAISRLDVRERERETILRFSAKEAVYKALDPYVRRYVAFHEVSVTPLDDGHADVQLHLRADEGPFTVDVRWLRWDEFVLTTARISRTAPSSAGHREL